MVFDSAFTAHLKMLDVADLLNRTVILLNLPVNLKLLKEDREEHLTSLMKLKVNMNQHLLMLVLVLLLID